MPPRFQKQQQDSPPAVSQQMGPPPSSSSAQSSTRQQPPSPAGAHPPMPHGFRPGQMPPPPWGPHDPRAWPGMPPPYFMDPRYGPRPPLDMQGKRFSFIRPSHHLQESPCTGEMKVLCIRTRHQGCQGSHFPPSTRIN